MVKYTYDAWGNHAVADGNGNTITDETNIGHINPFRYRGYYYDTETELYFLKTRYYDPEIGRFMTIDGIEYLAPETVNGLNLYAYCGNNPVMGVDPNGTSWWNPFSWDWGKVKQEIKNAVQTVANTVSNITNSIQTTYNSIKETVSTVAYTYKNMQKNYEEVSTILSVASSLDLKNTKTYSTVSTNLIPGTGASPNTGITGPGMGIDGGPYIDPNAKGWEKDGEFHWVQKTMGVVAGLGYLGILVGLVIGLAGVAVGVPIFAISSVVAIVAAAIGGFGGAT